MKLNSRRIQVFPYAFLVLLILGLMALSAGASVSELSDLGSSTHPSETTWYDDDSPSFEWAPAYPALLGSADTTGAAIDIAMFGNVAYVADGSEGLAAFDITDPANPVCLDTIAAGWAQEVCVAGDVVYVAGKDSGLFAIDASDPENLVLLDVLDSADGAVGGAWAVDVSGDMAYISTETSSAVRSVDVSDPLNLTVVDTLPMHHRTAGITVVGDVAYVAENDWGMYSVDVSDPSNLSELSYYSSAAVKDVRVAGDVAYLSINNTGFKTVDVSDPSNMVGLDAYAGDSLLGRGLDVVGDLVFLGALNDGVVVFDVSDPSDVTLLGEYGTTGAVSGVAVHGDAAFVAAGEEGIVVLDIMDYVTPAVLDSWASSGSDVNDVAIEGNLAYLAHSGDGLTLIDISDPQALSTEATLTTGNAAQGVVVQGDVAYVANHLAGLTTVDVADPQNPTILGSYDTAGSATDVKVAGDVAYLADSDNGFVILDISDPSVPTSIGAYVTGDGVYGVDVEGDVAYLAGQDAFYLIGIADPTAPVYLGSWPSPTVSAIKDVVVERGYAYLACFYNDVRVIDVSDPMSPIWVATESVSGAAQDVKVEGDRLFVTSLDGYVTILDISDPTDPTDPVVYNSALGDWNSAVALAGDVMYVATRDYGLEALQIGTYPTGFSYDFDGNATTDPDGVIDGTTTSKAYAGVADGEHYFHVRTADRFGNAISATQHRKVKIDTTAPMVSTDAVAEYAGSATIKITATDAGSGVYSIFRELDGGSGATTQATSVTVNVDTLGEHSIRFRARDNLFTNSEYEIVDFTIVSDHTDYTPVAGANRYDTAIKTSQAAFADDTADCVVIATGTNWPDALGGAALAAAKNGPILLTAPSALTEGITAEIDRLGATEVYILGGTSAVSSDVEDALVATLDRDHVERIWGLNRYATAEAIAAETVATLEAGAGYDGTAFVATGANFPDALAASPLAAAKGWPIFLCNPAGDPPTTVMSGLGVTDALILGGTAVISDSQRATLKSALPGDVERLSGDNRYATGVAVATYGVDEAGLAWNGLAFSTGQNFPDALAGGVLAGRNGSVMLLTDPWKLPIEVGTKLTAERDWIESILYLGGLNTITQDVRDEVAALLH